MERRLASTPITWSRPTVQLSGAAYGAWRVGRPRTHDASSSRSASSPASGGAAATSCPLEVGWREPVRHRAASRRRRAPRMRRRRNITASARATSRRWARRWRRTRVHEFDNPRRRQAVVIVNETFAKRFLSDRAAVGRVITSMTTGIGPLGANLFAPPQPPPPGSHRAAAADALRDRRRRRRRQQRAARTGRRAGDLFLDPAISVPRAVHRRARQRSHDGAGRPIRNALKAVRRTCRWRRPRPGARSSRRGPRSRAC